MLQSTPHRLFKLAVAYDLYSAGMDMSEGTQRFSSAIISHIETIRSEHQQQLARKLELLAKLSEKVKSNKKLKKKKKNRNKEYDA